ncbi:MAG: ion transporter [Pseudomonadota bacterium]
MSESSSSEATRLAPSHRERLAIWIETMPVRKFIIGVILLNAVILGLETSSSFMANWGPILIALDRACLAFFCVELLIKLYAFGPKFFRDPWNWFDAIIITIALMPSSGSMSVLRALRILRLLRVISAAPRLRRVVEGFIQALPGMGSVFLLMGLIFYIGAVMATKMFGGECAACTPEEALLFQEWFGTVGTSAYSLFQIMTLESWSMGIVRPVMDVYPWAWAFFVPFIMVTTFAVVNLLVGLIVNSMQDAHSEEANAQTSDYREEVMKRLAAIEAKLETKERS